ncbi:MAG: hypothetical protein Q7U91_14945 [Sideroxyarcus sp.]|nr:hypothetical protein [Sideroxyarcus sp.]
MVADKEFDSVIKVSKVVEALKAGTLKFRHQDSVLVDELLALPRGVTGLLDISKLSPQALAFARVTALALTHFEQQSHEEQSVSALPLHDAQCALFQHYENLFKALTGVSSDSVTTPAEIKARMLERFRHRATSFIDDINVTVGELEQFYRENAISLFQAGKSLGGVKVVSGGQRTFGISAQTSTRIAGLYCDTQLIPDPIYPFLTGNLHLNALHLQLAIILFHILPLRPLVDARLSPPPILVFPSFEEGLEEKDAVTQAGIASLILKVVGPVCDAKLEHIEDLFEYARKHEQEFLDTITREKLFVPPGGDHTHIVPASVAADIYLKELQGIREQELLRKMEQLPRGVLVLNGILERLRPQYHLRENAEELDAQPILSQAAHWYYFERCAQAEARELVNEKVLTTGAFDVLRALQDDSLTWLGNVPVNGLVELRQRMEHAELREQLRKFTAQLGAAGPTELESVVREVRHGLDALIQRQQQAIRDIEDKYSTKMWAAGTGSIFGAGAGASMYFLPSLAAAAGISAPAASILAALAGGGLTAAKETVSKTVEKRRLKRSMLGMLATARHVSK